MATIKNGKVIEKTMTHQELADQAADQQNKNNDLTEQYFAYFEAQGLKNGDTQPKLRDVKKALKGATNTSFQEAWSKYTLTQQVADQQSIPDSDATEGA